MGKLKSCVSRALNEAVGYREKRWSRHGSTRWLWEYEHVERAVHYVVHRQGRAMAVYENPEWPAL